MLSYFNINIIKYYYYMVWNFNRYLIGFMLNIVSGIKYNLTVLFCTLVLKLCLHYYDLCMPH